MRPWDVVERFEAGELDPGLWLPHYLPHWTTPDRSRARYALVPDGLELSIEADQLPWRPEDGAWRVSHVQTGSFGGPVGSRVGQHRIGNDLVVRTETPTWEGWTARKGAVEVTASACTDPHAMVGIWLVGHEAAHPHHSGEVCLAELFGDRLGDTESQVRVGIKAHHDPLLSDEVADVSMPIDASTPHRYGARWDDSGVSISVDGAPVMESTQTLDYPLQLMIDLFEFPPGPRHDHAYPLRATVHEVLLRGER